MVFWVSFYSILGLFLFCVCVCVWVCGEVILHDYEPVRDVGTRTAKTSVRDFLCQDYDDSVSASRDTLTSSIWVDILQSHQPGRGATNRAREEGGMRLLRQVYVFCLPYFPSVN